MSRRSIWFIWHARFDHAFRRQRSIRERAFGERLAELGAVPSIGTVGDFYDNALAETVKGYYTTERDPLKRPQQGPWRTVNDV